MVATSESGKERKYDLFAIQPIAAYGLRDGQFKNFGLFLTAEGKVYFSGSGNTDLGLGDQNSPKELPFFSDKTSIRLAAATGIAYVVTEDGKVFTWGDASPTPTEVVTPSGESVIDVSLNDEGEYALFLTESGKVYGLGSNTFGQQGLGNTTTTTTMTLVQGVVAGKKNGCTLGRC